MTNQEIIEGNKLIAQFLGGIIVEPKVDNEGNCLFDMGKTRKQNEQFWNSKSLKYHKDWNWLMPCVTKCVENGIRYSEWTNQLHDGLLNQDITDCWVACVEFIYENNNEKS